MKSWSAVLTLSFLCLTAAEVQQLNATDEEDNGNVCSCSGSDNFQFHVILRELEAKLRNTEKQLEDLRREVQRQQVAFGASLGIHGDVGPYNADITLTYRNVFYNTGSFNPPTGIFTAPVRGVYYFSFSGHNRSIKPMGLRLMKNGENMVLAFNHAAGNRHETATQGMILPLEVGDQVYIRLVANTWIFDNGNIHGTFIGHLLFSL